ncbi:hypothetical protein QTG54_003923 [Skeletonema marinoi]|uniref:Uncharacterized protein n=1 Tax=Skeletonema marinoi TaxID=267567 RepID=A0AAD8YI69_9STRA|nr:hypothetical protein QTG54_003923 [Skeletonema marinoi]
MINFVDSLMLNKDIKSFIDADQWIKNFAAYAVTLNQDSIIDLVNNLYLGTVDNGGSWSIVQYDHNSIASRAGRAFCGSECQHRMIYHPILRPSCKSVEDHFILGRVLNNEECWETYLKYVEEFVGVVESSIADLRSYGHIKMYVVDDAFAKDQTVESYEESELGLDYSDYNRESNPLLKTLSARLDEVKAQLDAIRSGTLPRDGKYGENEKCPDWRDDDGSDYIAGSTYDEDSCFMPIPDCEQAAPCYENSPFTCVDGNLVIEECKQASPFCDSCYPASACGSRSKDESGKFVESDSCGPEFAQCNLGSPCFDHKSGMCAYDGSILIEECKEAELFCKACFPYSRCGTLEEDDDEEEATDSSTS